MDVCEPVARPSSPPRYSVVVPVFNEGANMAAFCEGALRTFPPGYEILICYDHDSDDTLPSLAGLASAARLERLRCIKNDLGPGVRYAIEAGMRAAEAPAVLVMMADLCDDGSRIEALLELIESGADVACASRYCPGGAQIGGPWLKGALSRVAGLSLFHLTGLPTRDATNSFKAYRREYLARTPIESTAGFSLGIELTVKAHFGGGKVAEVPAVWRERVSGESRFRLMKWLPGYLRWYMYACRGRLTARRRS